MMMSIQYIVDSTQNSQLSLLVAAGHFWSLLVTSDSCLFPFLSGQLHMSKKKVFSNSIFCFVTLYINKSESNSKLR